MDRINFSLNSLFFSRMINKEDKEFIKLKFGLSLKRIIEENKLKAKENQLQGTKDHKLISSLRKLEAATGLRFATLQQIAAGEVNATCTTIVTIAETLGLSLSQFFSYYDNTSEKEVKDYVAAIIKGKVERSVKKQKKESKKQKRSKK